MSNAEAKLEPLAMHQTVIVPPSRVPPLFLLTIPTDEVSAEGEPVCDAVADLLDSTGPPMTLERWTKILRRVEPELRELADSWERFWRFWPESYHLQIIEEYHKETRKLISRLRAHTESPQFARGLIEGLLSGPELAIQPRLVWRPFQWPLWPSPASLLAEAAYANRRELELSEGEAATWALIASIVAADKSQRAVETLENISDFDVPFALSRRSDKSPLSSILSEARMVVFFPIAPGAVLAAQHISQGAYVVALEVVAVSGATTLILAATYSLAERLLRLGRRKRQ